VWHLQRERERERKKSSDPETVRKYVSFYKFTPCFFFDPDSNADVKVTFIFEVIFKWTSGTRRVVCILQRTATEIHHSYYKVQVRLRTWNVRLKELYFVHIQRILTTSLMMLQCPLILPACVLSVSRARQLFIQTYQA
jgi:hypothetical protein